MTEISGPSNDLVRILAQLTDEVERFDSLVLSHRKMLERLSARKSDVDNDQFNRQAERITVEAAQVVASARQALAQLNRLAEPSESFALQTRHSRPRGAPKHRLPF